VIDRMPKKEPKAPVPVRAALVGRALLLMDILKPRAWLFGWTPRGLERTRRLQSSRSRCTWLGLTFSLERYECVELVIWLSL
jgi:hypothetical protein